MSEQVFTVDDIANLENFQRNRFFHPYTCPNRQDGQHGNIDGDKGILVPTVRGWICRYCDYRQGRSPEFMRITTDGVTR